MYHSNNYDESTVSERATTQNSILHSFVDRNHALDTSHQHSISGFLCKLAGGVILYKTKVQTIVAQSSMEAEFIAVAEPGKNILYLCTIMQEIGLEQQEASILYEDNQGAFLMAQSGQPTKRTKHIDIKHFVLKQRVEQDMIPMRCIVISDNVADVLTKATLQTLF